MLVIPLANRAYPGAFFRSVRWLARNLEQRLGNGKKARKQDCDKMAY